MTLANIHLEWGWAVSEHLKIFDKTCCIRDSVNASFTTIRIHQRLLHYLSMIQDLLSVSKKRNYSEDSWEKGAS